jgi:hypothetical protein
VDFLNLDYQLRARFAEVQASLVRFRDEVLCPLIARWEVRCASEPAPVAGLPAESPSSATVYPLAIAVRRPLPRLSSLRA